MILRENTASYHAPHRRSNHCVAFFRSQDSLLGLPFVIFGLNGFLKFIPVPPFHPFVQILVSSGYIYFVKAIEVLAGGLLVVNRALLLALVLLGADIANIVAYHALLDHRN
jgi:putative oxidoreductase